LDCHRWSIVCVFYFFFLFWQLKCTIVLFVCYFSNQAWLSYPRRLGMAWLSDPRAWVWTYAPGSKNLKFFKSMIGLRKQTLPHSSRIFHSCTIELNIRLFFVYATYFINLLYLKRKEWKKKCWVSSNLFQAFKNKLSFFVCIVDENINFMFSSKFWTVF